MTIIAMVVSIFLGIGSLVWGYFDGGLTDPARWLVLTGAAWLIAEWRRQRWFASLGLFVIIIAAAYGLWIQLSSGWMVTGAVSGLLAWDLSDFARRLGYAAPTDDVAGMERRHLARAGVVAVIGAAIALIATFVHVRIPFEVAVVFVLLVAGGITRLVVKLRGM